jgi:hypothetical protein
LKLLLKIPIIEDIIATVSSKTVRLAFQAILDDKVDIIDKASQIRSKFPSSGLDLCNAPFSLFTAKIPLLARYMDFMSYRPDRPVDPRWYVTSALSTAQQRADLQDAKDGGIEAYLTFRAARGEYLPRLVLFKSQTPSARSLEIRDADGKLKNYEILATAIPVNGGFRVLDGQVWVDNEVWSLYYAKDTAPLTCQADAWLRLFAEFRMNKGTDWRSDR